MCRKCFPREAALPEANYHNLVFDGVLHSYDLYNDIIDNNCNEIDDHIRARACRRIGILMPGVYDEKCAQCLDAKMGHRR